MRRSLTQPSNAPKSAVTDVQPSAGSDPYDYDDFGPDSEDEDEFDDCGLMADGQCTKAGSEECDWICGRLG